ncbi:MAG TPA: ATP-binding protein [Candidatus Nitrosotenuis sp.]|jgi:serine/threonine-protein kinase RsbW|nr:ATP-binding protein [Candidatus Nitrosotenuis sp.]
MAQDEDRVEIEIPARPEFVRLVRLVMAGVGNTMRFNVDEIEDLKLAVGEACYCAFRLAEVGPLSRVRVESLVRGERLEVQVSRSLLPGETARVGADQPLDKGIGFVLIKHLVDEVNHTSERDRMAIRLVKARKVQELSLQRKTLRPI